MDGDFRGPGDNRPPADADPLRERLTEDHADLLKRRDELLAASERVPATVNNEETAKKVGDFIKQIGAAVKNADTARVAEKEPYLSGGRTVDGFFKVLITDPLAKAKRDIEDRLNQYLRKKTAEERQRREAEKRQRREEADRLAREAREQADKLISESLDSEAALNAAVDAEEVAQQAQADAEVAAKTASANAAEMSRTRGNYGSLASLRTYWDFRDIYREKLNLEELRSHLPLDALEKAVRSYIKAGGRDLSGVTIFENTRTQVR